jgi:Transmembrane secretion effector
VAPRLLPPDQLPAAFALGAISDNVAAIAGSVVAGVLISALGLPVVSAVDTVTFVLSAALIFRMAPIPTGSFEHGPSLRSVGAGLRFAARQSLVFGTYLVDLPSTAWPIPCALFPFPGGRPERVVGPGSALPAGAMGGLAATMTSGWTGWMAGPAGWLDRSGGCCWSGQPGGAVIVGVGVAHQLWLILAPLPVGGAVTFVGDRFRTAIRSATVPASCADESPASNSSATSARRARHPRHTPLESARAAGPRPARPRLRAVRRGPARCSATP